MAPRKTTLRMVLEAVAVLLAVVLAVMWILPPREKAPPQLPSDWTPRCEQLAGTWTTLRLSGASTRWERYPLDEQPEGFVVQGGQRGSSMTIHWLGYDGRHVVGPSIAARRIISIRREHLLWMAAEEGTAISIRGLDATTLAVVEQGEYPVPAGMDASVVSLMDLPDGKLGILCWLRKSNLIADAQYVVLTYDPAHEDSWDTHLLVGESDGVHHYDKEHALLTFVVGEPRQVYTYDCRTWELTSPGVIPPKPPSTHTSPQVMPYATLAGPRVHMNHYDYQGPALVAAAIRARRMLWIGMLGEERLSKRISQQFELKDLRVGPTTVAAADMAPMEDPDLLATAQVSKFVSTHIDPRQIRRQESRDPFGNITTNCILPIRGYATESSDTLIVQAVFRTPVKVNRGEPILRFGTLAVDGTAIAWKGWLPLIPEADASPFADLTLRVLDDGRWLVCRNLTILGGGAILSYTVIDPIEGVSLPAGDVQWGYGMYGKVAGGF